MSPILISFTVPGQARPKGSLAGICRRDRAHTIIYKEQVIDSKKWRQTVATHCRLAMQRSGLSVPVPYALAVRVRVRFHLAPTMSVRNGVSTGVPVPSHRTPHPTDIKIGDADKLERNVGDALTDAGLLADDSLIIGWDSEKVWAADWSAPHLMVEVTAA